jgi:hypothetical protein
MTSISTITGQADMESKVANLYTLAFNLFGVSFNALFYLANASVDPSTPGDWYLSALEESGDINYIRELEAKQYARLQITQGHPDGTEMDKKWLQILPIGDGIILRQYLLAPHHT